MTASRTTLAIATSAVTAGAGAFIWVTGPGQVGAAAHPAAGVYLAFAVAALGVARHRRYTPRHRLAG